MAFDLLTRAGSFAAVMSLTTGDRGCCRGLRVTVQLRNRCVSAPSGPILRVWCYFGSAKCPQTEEVAYISASDSPQSRETHIGWLKFCKNKAPLANWSCDPVITDQVPCWNFLSRVYSSVRSHLVCVELMKERRVFIVWRGTVRLVSS